VTADRSADRHKTDRHVFSLEEEDWDELGRIVGDRQRSELVRRLVRAFLRRPDVRMPRRSDYEPDQPA
jgi:metal-responsive CopG/Arc/MetJ family transcriptional regulator